jgi:hypothetical protein
VVSGIHVDRNVKLSLIKLMNKNTSLYPGEILGDVHVPQPSHMNENITSPIKFLPVHVFMLRAD